MYRCFALGIDFLLKLFEKRERQGSNYFEAPLNWFVAQLAEYPAFNRGAVSSILTGPTWEHSSMVRIVRD